MEAIIAGASKVEQWRQVAAKFPQVIAYCEQREIRREEHVEEIYLLKKRQMNGAHAELFSYALYYELRASVVAAKFAPLKLESYQSVSGTDYEPYVLLSCDLPKCRLRFGIASASGQFRISLIEANGKAVPQAVAVLRSKAEFTGPDQSLTRLSSRQNIQKVLQTAATLLAGLPDTSS